jgi:HAD superfamily hydrolase (TIGR01484 family)
MEAEDKISLADFELIAFDLDDTLTESKMPLDAEMSGLLARLLDKKLVAVISGASFNQLDKQFLGHLSATPDQLKNLYLLPTCGSALYYFQDDWKLAYIDRLSPEEKDRIMKAFDSAFQENNWKQPEKIYGDLIEDRESQITFSGLGGDAPLELKAVWDPDHEKRESLAAVLRRELPEFSIGFGGGTSIDVTRQGVDKASGLRRLSDHLGMSLERFLYVGDALYIGGNDDSVIQLEFLCIDVDNIGTTKKLIGDLLTGGNVTVSY